MFKPTCHLWRFALPGFVVVTLSVGFAGCGQVAPVEEGQPSQQESHAHAHAHDHGHGHDNLPSEEEAQAAVAAAQAQIAADPKLQRQLAEYPLKTCFIMPEDVLDDEHAVDYVHEGRAMRLCCLFCVQEFMAEPEKFLRKLDEALDKEAAGTQ